MAKALFAFLMLPGVVAGVIPALLLLAPGRVIMQSRGFAVTLGIGLAILIASAVSFYRRGYGTLAPWDPPQRLVVEDLYRLTRNPMYLGVALVLLGWAGLTGALWHWAYTIIVPILFHVRVIHYEEPEMARRFPEDWPHYRDHVPRWGIRATPYRPDEKD